MPTDQPPTPILDQQQRDHFQQRLLEERKRALREMGEMGEQLSASQKDWDGSLTSIPFHMADQGTDTIDREQGFLFASRESRLIEHVDAALRRLYAAPETFGRCEECGKPIGYDRLDALPYVTRCIDCKEQWEGGSDATTPEAPPPA